MATLIALTFIGLGCDVQPSLVDVNTYSLIYVTEELNKQEFRIVEVE